MDGASWKRSMAFISFPATVGKNREFLRGFSLKARDIAAAVHVRRQRGLIFVWRTR